MNDNRQPAPGTGAPGQSCQLCGAATRSDGPLCDSCANPADTMTDTPLPPIPDGGLSRTMPAWLRSSPCATPGPAQSSQPAPDEFASILSDEDIPVWLKRMAERHSVEQAQAARETERPARPASRALGAPTATTADISERGVMVGAVPSRPVDPPTSATPRSRRSRLPTVENRAAIGIGILAAFAAVVILAIVLFG